MSKNKFAPSDFARADLAAALGLTLKGVAVAVLLILASLLLIKNANIVSPIMNWDEYAYFAQSREFPNLAALQIYDPGSSQSNNVLYFWLGQKFWEQAIDPALTMRLVQALLYMLIAPVLYVLCRRFLGRLASAALTIVALTSGLSSFSGYYMPETLYTLLFFSLMAWAVCSIGRPILSALGSGFLVALMALTKPHGISIIAGIALAWMLCLLLPRVVGISRRQSALALLFFVIALYVSLVSVNGLLTGHMQFDPRFFIGTAYTQFWSGKSRALAPFRDVITVIAGNAAPLALLIGLPFIYSAVALFRSSPPDTIAKSTQQLRFLAVLLFCISVMTLGMTVNFTAQVGDPEIWRIHGRYYSFLIPLYLVLMFATAVAWTRRSTDKPALWMLRATALCGLGLVAVIQVFWRWGYEISPSDFPEIFAMSNTPWIAGAVDLGTSVVILAAATFALILFLPQRAPIVFAAFFLVLNVASVIQVSRWQFAHMRSFSPYTSMAAALHSLIPADRLDRGVFIGTNRSNTSFFLVGLRSRSRVVTVPSNSVVDQARVGDADWVIVDGPLYVQLPGARVMLTSGNLSFLTLKDFAPFKVPG